MSSHNTFHLFVYGSLRSGFRSPAYEYISNYFDLVGEAKVKGKLFDMGDYPAAIPTEENLFIIGELYLIKREQEFSWAIGQLDDYEGVITEEGDIPLYRREQAAVLINNTTVMAWVYWYNRPVDGKPLIISGDILDFLK
jgi:gamma-glutamylcyclotransferase (GGCT)/AIG2-like uncharacterized protein YtfP